MPAKDLILKELLPLAEQGLREASIGSADIERYLGVIEKRVDSGRTGARWQLESLEHMKSSGSLHERLRALTASMVQQQQTDKPIAEWELAEFCGSQDWRESYRTVRQFMATDLFTVRPDDIVDFAASLMEWRYVRHVPVEDDAGRLLGLISHRQLLRLIARGIDKETEPVMVRDIMRPDPKSIGPETTTVEAIRLMRENKLSCLPVTENGKLVGLVTEYDLIVVASRLLESVLDE